MNDDQTTIRVTLDLTVTRLSDQELADHAYEAEMTVGEIDTVPPNAKWFAEKIAEILPSPEGNEMVFEGTDYFVKIIAVENAIGELPIPMVLHCPTCRTQHVDAPEPYSGWDNPPHKSHLCAMCGAVWRPADVLTTGVAAISTRGEKDTYP